MDESRLSRRGFVGLLAAATLAPAIPAWALPSDGARLTERPRKPTQSWKVGLTPLGDTSPAAFLYIPKSYDPTRPTPLVIGLHGAGQRASVALRVWTPQADATGFVLLAPESSDMTWDAIRGTYGEDPRMIDRALKFVFDRVNVDPERIVMQGFSDGASYGLGLALNNMDLFTKVVANSPGFITRYEKRRPGRKPRIFLSHGHQDQILPFEMAGARVVGQLRNEGFSVQFREFDGGHSVPVEIAVEATKFIMN